MNSNSFKFTKLEISLSQFVDHELSHLHWRELSALHLIEYNINNLKAGCDSILLLLFLIMLIHRINGYKLWLIIILLRQILPQTKIFNSINHITFGSTIQCYSEPYIAMVCNWSIPAQGIGLSMGWPQPISKKILKVKPFLVETRVLIQIVSENRRILIINF